MPVSSPCEYLFLSCNQVIRCQELLAIDMDEQHALSYFQGFEI